MLIRRSNLLVPLADAAAVNDSWRHDADAVTLDLERCGARVSHAAMQAAIAVAGRGAAEVFVRPEKARLEAGLDASVWPGLRGVMLPQVESAAYVAHAEAIVGALERERGIEPGSLAFIVVLESARAVWDIRQILTASPRISQAGLDERSLAANLGIEPDPELDPFVYARGRLAVEATAAKVGAIGMAYPASVTQPRDASPADIGKRATRARNSGMKGVLCPHARWVAPVNAAFTPTAERVQYNRRVREAFAAGIAAGTAAVPLDGRMIDVPVDEWAIVVLAMAEACAARDAQKREASAAQVGVGV
jgi:citrate lyase subunit beta/citryl-CoA lyase